MRNYNNDDRTGGGWKPKRSFDRGFGGDREKPEMHQTVCSECGNECEVPFKPNGRKPVFCKSCFRKDEFDEGGSDRRDFGRDRDNFEKPRFEQPRFEKPRFEKPAYKEQGSGDSNKAQFEMLNFKMDMILKTLHQMGAGTAAPVAPKAKEFKKVEETPALSKPIKIKAKAKAKKKVA
ncbi:MAG: CxxC-x17-CxxC domain-containing protein [Candidatus Gracilibacteria bacterium]